VRPFLDSEVVGLVYHARNCAADFAGSGSLTGGDKRIWINEFSALARAAPDRARTTAGAAGARAHRLETGRTARLGKAGTLQPDGAYKGWDAAQ